MKKYLRDVAGKVKSELRTRKAGRKFINAIEKHKVGKISVPTRLIIEPSSMCNFLCPKCLYPDMEREKEFLALEKLEQFLGSWKAQYGSFETVEFTGSGEVLVNKEFGQIVSLFNKLMPTAKLMTTSNLALLNKGLANDLLRSGLRYWQVSFDSAEESEFEKFTGSKKFTRVVENIKLLFEEMQANPSEKNRLSVVAHRPFDDKYESGMQAIKELLGEHCHDMTFAPYQSLNGRITAYAVSEIKFYDKKKVPIVCSYLWTDLVVVQNGDIRLCCSDMFDSTIKFGNIFTDSPEQIMQNRDRSFYKEKQLEGDLSQLYLCRTCHAPFA